MFEEARAQAEANRRTLRRQLNHMSTQLPRAHETGRQIRRALTDWKNLVALGKNHTTVGSLVQALLSRRVGKLRQSAHLFEHLLRPFNQLGDIGGLQCVLETSAPGAGADPSMLDAPDGRWIALDCWRTSDSSGRTRRRVPRGPSASSRRHHTRLAWRWECSKYAADRDGRCAAFDSLTAVDLETTDNDTAKAEIVEIAAVRVREGIIVEEFHRLVKPRVPIAIKATETHGYTAADLVDAPYFEDVWPDFRVFCGDDVIVAHNGYEFDFRILQRMTKPLAQRFDSARTTRFRWRVISIPRAGSWSISPISLASMPAAPPRARATPGHWRTWCSRSTARAGRAPGRRRS